MNWTVRPAVAGDAEELVRLRVVMFEAMGRDVANTDWERPCVELFRRELGGPGLIAAVVDAPGGGLASCAAAFIRLDMPRPGDLGTSMAHLHNVCTDPAWRRRGLARLVVTALVDRLDDLGLVKCDLHATEEGRGLYESLGFQPRTGGLEMVRKLKF
ncbi:GNAT family N-acetyltransferase [Kutzneria sp. CA-103260]|uniref:GNAT family N-acetyltransferase n=1 Tax=Kutzneria sp. CA-103260 TaxID=2802641 RepID=UPI001BA703AA|nr:GNAT family N-acetyltransferase [Kutzneria sp. CA-103260]QUQ67772.1 GNAT family N-acetyltransferase [Kutzneria sp. CA-103260]